MTAKPVDPQEPVVSELRLTAFKSFRDVVLPLSPLTVLIGRNSSGKSNALDGLEVLSRLARGDEIRDALDARGGDLGPIRGGLEGCVPHGDYSFRLGCTVQGPRGPITLDVEITVEPDVEIVYERLTGPAGRGTKVLLETRSPDPRYGGLQASWHNGRRGPSPNVPLKPYRLLTTQLPLAVRGDTVGERDVLEAVEVLLSALRGVFHLDPVPHLMRQYVPQRDVALRRSAENLSATVGWLERAEDPRFRRLVELVQDLSDHEIRDVSLIRSELGDVMLTLEEGPQGRTPAREMSDGMLRFMAISTALLTGGRSLEADGGDDAGQPVMLVIEELENGVHPSQASALLNLVRQASQDLETQIAVTTHSPALLNALDAADHAGVMVCSRDRATGTSRITPLTALDGYAVAMASGELGDVVTKGGIPAAPSRDRDFSEFDRLLGIG